MPIRDIRDRKKSLRTELKEKRMAMTQAEKEAFDAKIAEQLFSFGPYVSSKIVFVYVAKSIEAETRGIILHSLSAGKCVAVPKCAGGSEVMDFCFIEDINDLTPGAFGIMEPGEGAKQVRDFSRGICIVPGLGFDDYGYRLGYGMGYYDRFLAGFGGVTVGLCYSNCVQAALPYGKFDRRVQYLITEKSRRRTD